jgi:uncharacterized protein with HEPN domain
MSPERNWTMRVEDILTCIEKVQAYTRGMRNIVAHEYFGVSLSIVWRAIEDDLPALVKGLEKLIGSC